MLARQLGVLDVDRAGMGFLFGDAYLGEVLDQNLGLDLELPRQLVNPNLICFWHPPLFLVPRR